MTPPIDISDRIWTHDVASAWLWWKAAEEAEKIHSPEEDVAGLAAGVGMHQLFLQVLQRAVVDIDWTPQLWRLSGTLLRQLPIETDVTVCCEGHRELDSIFISWIWNNKKIRTVNTSWNIYTF